MTQERVTFGRSIKEDRYIPYAMQIVRSAHVLRMYLKYLKSDNLKDKYMKPTGGGPPLKVQSILSRITKTEDDLFQKPARVYARLSELPSLYRPISIFTLAADPTHSRPSMAVAWAQCGHELEWMAISIKEIMDVVDRSDCIGKILRAHPPLKAKEKALREIWEAARLVVKSTDAILHLCTNIDWYRDEWVPKRKWKWQWQSGQCLSL